jgi:tellurite resistance protein TerC
VFGAFLIYTAFKMVKHHGQEVDPANSLVIRLARRFLPVSVSSNDGRFWVREAGKLAVTPLFLTLVVVEISDLIFAVDSIPAILAITDDSFIVYTSNVFAIMGLRSLYFALAGAVSVFAYLHYGLAAVLAFVGTKMLIADFYKIPVSWALAIVAVLLLISVVVSVVAQKSVSKNGGDTA